MGGHQKKGRGLSEKNISINLRCSICGTTGGDIVCPNCGRNTIGSILPILKQGEWMIHLLGNVQAWDYNGTTQRVICKELNILSWFPPSNGNIISKTGIEQLEPPNYEDWGYIHGKYYTPVEPVGSHYECPVCKERRPIRIPNRFGRCRRCGVYLYFVSCEKFERKTLRSNGWALIRKGDFIDVYGDPPENAINAFYNEGRRQSLIKGDGFFIAREGYSNYRFHGPFFMGIIQGGTIELLAGRLSNEIRHEIEEAME